MLDYDFDYRPDTMAYTKCLDELETVMSYMDIAQEFGIPVSVARRLVRSGCLVAKINGNTWVSRSSVVAYVEWLEQTSELEAAGD